MSKAVSSSSSGAAKKVLAGPKEHVMLGIRIPKFRLTSLGTSTISLPSPPRMLLLMATYVLLFFLMAGGVYMLIQNPIAVGSENGQAIYFYPDINDSFIIEGFIAAALLFMAGFGGVLLYQSSLQSMNKSFATKILIIGVILSIVAFMILQWIINIKQSGG
jgi:hypothetical protein